jgi:hypothetical protein
MEGLPESSRVTFSLSEASFTGMLNSSLDFCVDSPGDAPNRSTSQIRPKVQLELHPPLFKFLLNLFSYLPGNGQLFVLAS